MVLAVVPRLDTSKVVLSDGTDTSPGLQGTDAGHVLVSRSLVLSEVVRPLVVYFANVDLTAISTT